MARITWDQMGDRFYETGVSRGVFYDREGHGVPWNGLTQVDRETNTDLEALYYDGVKYGDVASLGEFSGKLKAFTYPDEFLAYEGIGTVQAGFMVADQPPQRFGLCYRTEIGNDLDSAAGYMLHVVYNVLAVPDTKVYTTMSLDTEPVDFEWDITTVPEQIDNHRPTSHLMIDSRKVDPFLLADVEAILYGSDEEGGRDSFLPSLKSLLIFVQGWGRLIITDHGDGSWSAYSPVPGVVEMTDATSFEINADEAVIVDPDTYTVESSAFDTGELWH